MSCSSQHLGPRQELGNWLSESTCHAPPSAASDQVPSDVSMCLAMGVLSSLCLNLLQSVCVTETDPPGQAGAALLGGILGAIVVVLLILGAGLYLWKRCGKKKNLKPGRGRLHFPSPTGPWTPSLLHFAAQGMSLQVAAWCGLGRGGHGVREGPGGQAQTQAPSVCDSGAGSQKEHGDPDGGIHYAELSQQEAGDNRDKVRLGEEAAWVLPSPSVPGCVPVNPSHLQVLPSMPL